MVRYVFMRHEMSSASVGLCWPLMWWHRKKRETASKTSKQQLPFSSEELADPACDSLQVLLAVYYPATGNGLTTSS